MTAPALPPVRRATSNDVPALLVLINRAYEVEHFFAVGDRTDTEEMRALFGAGDFLILDAPQAGEPPLGSVYVEARPDARAYLGLLSVQPAQQKNGVGRALVLAAEDHGRLLGARFMELAVVDLRTELTDWYARLGYAVSGEAAVPDKPGRFSRPVRFLRMEKPL